MRTTVDNARRAIAEARRARLQGDRAEAALGLFYAALARNAAARDAGIIRGGRELTLAAILGREVGRYGVRAGLGWQTGSRYQRAADAVAARVKAEQIAAVRAIASGAGLL